MVEFHMGKGSTRAPACQVWNDPSKLPDEFKASTNQQLLAMTWSNERAPG